MNVINFPGGSEPRVDPEAVERAVKLKQRLVRFVTQGPMREAHAELMHESGVDASNLYEFIDFTDWFIFEWEDEDGTRVIDELLAAESDLTSEERDLAEAWTEAIEDLFEVADRRESGFLLTDEEGERYFAVPTSVSAAELGLEPGMMVETRLLPVGDIHLLSGTQSVYRSRDEAEAAMQEELDDEVDRWLYDAFLAHFGGDEVVAYASEVPTRLGAFCRFALEEFKPEGADVTLGELARREGASLETFLDDLPNVEGEAGNVAVGILADPDEGLAIVPGYDMMRRYLDDGEGDPQALAELLMFLVEAPDIPAFAIRRLADAGPERFSSLMAAALGEPGFDARHDLDELLDDFKAGGDEELPEDLEDLFDDDLVYPDDLVDVREMAEEESPDGSLAKAARDYIDEVERTLKPETAEAHALAVNMLVHYAWENERSLVSQLDENLLLDFLAVWYPSAWGERSVGGARQLLTVTGRLAAWIDRAHATDLARRYKSGVLPKLKEDLPRVVKAALELEKGLPNAFLMSMLEAMDSDNPSSLGDALGALFSSEGSEEEEVEGSFAVVTIDGRTALARERSGEGAGDPDAIYKIDLPPKVAGQLRPGDTIVGTIVPDDHKWRVQALTAIYPPVAGA